MIDYSSCPRRRLITIISNQSQKVDEDVDDVHVDGHGAVYIVLFVHLILRVLSTNDKSRVVRQEERKQGCTKEAVNSFAEWEEPIRQNPEPLEEVDQTIYNE